MKCFLIELLYTAIQFYAFVPVPCRKFRNFVSIFRPVYACFVPYHALCYDQLEWGSFVIASLVCLPLCLNDFALPAGDTVLHDSEGCTSLSSFCMAEVNTPEGI